MDKKPKKDKKSVKNYYDQRWKERSKEINPPRLGWIYQKSRIDKMLSYHIKHIQPGNILEIGIGKGDLALKISDFNFIESYTGIDISEEGISIAQKRIKNSKFSFLVGDCTDLPLQGKYDLIIFSEVIEHIEEKQKALNEIFRVLKPGGYLLLTTPNPDSVSYFLPKLGRRLKHRENYGSNQIINKLINKSRLIKSLKQAGFTLIEYRGLVFQPFSISLLENAFKHPIGPWQKFSEYLENKKSFSDKALYQFILAQKID